MQVRSVYFQRNITTYWPGMQNTMFLVTDPFEIVLTMLSSVCKIFKNTNKHFLVFSAFLSCKCNHINCDQPPVKLQDSPL